MQVSCPECNMFLLVVIHNLKHRLSLCHCIQLQYFILKIKSKYRWLSLSQSPGDQTKYFEISVVWDSQYVMSFTFFMYVELQLARKQSKTVKLRNVTDSTLFIHSKNICDQCLFCTSFPQVYLWYTLINLTQFLQHVGNVCCVHQRTLLNPRICTRFFFNNYCLLHQN